MIEAIRIGRIKAAPKGQVFGALGTWANGIHLQFDDKRTLINVLAEKLVCEDPEQRAYVHQYLINTLHVLSPKPSNRLIRGLTHLLEQHDRSTYDALSFVDWATDDDWSMRLIDKYRAFTVGDDDVPF